MPNIENEFSSALNPTERAERYASGGIIGGKYRLETPIGEGGMGTVWRACNLMLEAPVALKLVNPDLRDAEITRRLLTEARVEAQLKHPNLVRVFDFGKTVHGDAYIVMELLEGISLGDLMERRGRLDPVEAVQLVLPIVSALCHAHENGVVHRDLKPQNIFLDRVGPHTSPKLLDFGIAKLTAEPEHHGSERGTLIGSPAYMAPEQAQGSAEVDHRADIWAICVLLYEAISGAAAFPGEGYAVLRSVIQDTPKPLVDTGAGEGTLWTILARGLEKDPAHRHRSMLELGAALAHWLRDRGESEDIDGNRISRSWRLYAPHKSGSDPSATADERMPAHRDNDAIRPRRELQELDVDLGHQSTLSSGDAPVRHTVRKNAWAAVGGVGALAAAIGVLWAPASTMSDPAGIVPIATHAQPSAPLASAFALPERAPLERMTLANAEIEASPARLTRVATDAEARPSVAPDPAKHMAKRSAEAEELGLKVPY